MRRDEFNCQKTGEGKYIYTSDTKDMLDFNKRNKTETEEETNHQYIDT